MSSFAGAAQVLPDVVFVDEAAQEDSTRLAGSQAPAKMHACGPTTFRLMYTSGTTDRPKGVMHSYSISTGSARITSLR
jgi:fatty-acyl-CoA synthase